MKGETLGEIPGRVIRLPDNYPHSLPSSLHMADLLHLMYKLDTNGWPKHIDGDLAQHRFVTTPIAYLSSSIADPFFKPQMRDNSPEWGWFKGQYHLEPAFFWHLGQWPGLSLNEPAFWAQQQNVAFFVMSIGPDAVFEMQTPTATIQATALPAPETSFYL